MNVKLITSAAGIAAVGGAVFAAYRVNRLNKQRGYFKEGNHHKYDVSRVPFCQESPLKGKTIIFLGSSVTKGFASRNVSFPDYISKRNSCTCIKEAVNGTTLVDIEDKSYVERMRNNLDRNRHVDLFVCQLSTNDSTRGCPLGAVSGSFSMEDFDTTTICGAIEYIILYAKNTWHCPVMFYTNPVYDAENYREMVEALLKIREKWGIGVIDFWNNEAVNKKLDENRELYMQDPVHPMKAGYLECLVPVMEREIAEYLKQAES